LLANKENLTLGWRKSRACGNGADCVEVAQSDNFVFTRNSRDREGAVLRFPNPQWRRFLLRIKESRLEASAKAVGTTSGRPACR